MNQNDENIEYNNAVTGVPVNQEVRDFENAQFSYWMKKYNVSSEYSDNLCYIREYCMKGARVDGNGILEVPQDAIFHYISREKKIKFTNFTKERFDNHEEMQISIEKLNLDKDATYEFILFVWYELKKLYNAGKRVRLGTAFENFVEELNEDLNVKTKMSIKVGKTSIKLNDRNTVESLLYCFSKSDSFIMDLTVNIPYTQHDKSRFKNYLLSILLQNLPIIYDKPKKGAFSQAERDFGLSVLWLISSEEENRFRDQSEYCSFCNNATFDKIMREYKNDILPCIIR